MATRQAVAPKKLRTSTRASHRAGPVRSRYASPSDALAARLAEFAPRSPFSVTENEPATTVLADALAARLAELPRTTTRLKADRSCTQQGWEKTVSLFDDQPGADRSTRRPELIRQKNNYTGKPTDAPSSTSEILRGHLIQTHAGLPAPVAANPDALISKSDRNWVTFVDNGGDLTAVIKNRRAAVIPAGLSQGWAAQNVGKKIWR